MIDRQIVFIYRICVTNTARLVSLQARVARDLELLQPESSSADGKEYWVGRRSLQRWGGLARRVLEGKIRQEEREFKERCGSDRRKRARNECFEEAKAKLLRLRSNVSISLSNSSSSFSPDICDTAGLLVSQPGERTVKPQVRGDQIVEATEVSQNSERTEERFNADLLCPHGNLRTEAGCRRLVSQEAWRRLESYFTSPVTIQLGTAECGQCREKRGRLREEALSQRSRLSSLYLGTNRPSLSPPGCRKIFLLPTTFLQTWRASVRALTEGEEEEGEEVLGETERVTMVNNRSLLCAHQHFIHLPALSIDQQQNTVLVMVSQEEWDIVRELFTVDVEIKVERKNGLNGPDLSISPPPCHLCYDSRLGESPTYESSVTVRTLGERRTEQREIFIHSEMLLSQLKLKVMESFNVSPNDQTLLHNGQYLRANNFPLWQLNISPGSLIFLRVEQFVILEVGNAGDDSEYLPETVGNTFLIS